MAKSKPGTVSRRALTHDQILELIKRWDTTPATVLAEEFGVSPATVNSMAKEIRKQNPDLCKSKVGGTTRKAAAAAAIEAFLEAKS